MDGLAGVDDAWSRVREGHPVWLVAAVACEGLSFAGYVVLFRAVLGDGWFGWRISVLITFAGVALTRLFAAGGAGGVALTAWALRRAGRERHRVAVDLWSFLAMLYAVFMAALVLVGTGLATGLLSGPSPASLTVRPAACRV